jgi:oligopeptide/dipeptide ABC transporter ATP-binding protein
MIAMALSSNPDLVIADEPTATLDVTIQDQILELLMNLKQELGLSILLITHNLGIVAEICDQMGVLYAGFVVESGSKEAIFGNPSHPYTRGLLNALPKPGESKKKLHTIRGSIPNFLDPPSGCRFHPRCDYTMDICKHQKPPVYEIEPGHKVACYLFDPKKSRK